MTLAWTRRRVLGLIAAAPAAALPRTARATGARVVIVGGGFGGSATAREIKRLAPEIQVTLVALDRTFVCCPGSNAVIGGFGRIEDQTVGYDALVREGIAVVTGKADAVDTSSRKVRLTDRTVLPYEKLVLSPGIGFHWDEVEGVSAATVRKVPHAWQAGEQTVQLRRQLEAMRDGGVFALVAPVGPLRCPPAVGERVSLVAHYFKTAKPRSKIVVFDAKSKFALQDLFEEAWADLYPGMIEYRLAESEGIVRAIDPENRIVSTDFDDVTADVINFIPRQRAADIALASGAADETGWCPVDPATFASSRLPHVHVIGDAAFVPPLPKAAATAVSVADTCAKAVVRDLTGAATADPRWHAGCFSLAAPRHGFEASTDFRLSDGRIAVDEATMRRTLVGASVDARQTGADKAEQWLRGIMDKVWG
ncbi:MAG: cytochrome C [Rhodospirillales bacterium CG15_BIG_FIL_POST_REV_8_21_14_020_66_15]|nr:MAG: cytochrome C [Rhodospirillales bacterium CG15_BIG_FIL_POST_REV_8_21_14_020_66_15]